MAQVKGSQLPSRPMRLLAYTLVLFAVLATGCDKDQDDQGYLPASITFATDSGLVYMNDTFPAGDTIRIRVTVAEGSERLYTLLVSGRYNGAPELRMDSLRMHALPFVYDTLYGLRGLPGSEQWTWTAVEGNGDRTSRSLTFVTQ